MLWIIVTVCVTAFLIYATKKKWVVWSGGRGLATLTAFHDFQPRDKQEGIEYVIERSASKKLEEQENGDPE